MNIQTNIPLKNFTTMKLGGPAKYFCDVRTLQELHTLYTDAKSKNIPIFVMGGGSNIIARDEGFNGLIIRLRIPGFEIIADEASSTTIKIGAGEVWDETVKKIVDMQLSGVETMSGIPGTVGAAPVQNIGAYGQEISDTLVSVDVYDTTIGQMTTLQNEDCDFSYRYSLFKGTQQGRYIITSVTLMLSKTILKPPFYDSLQKYLDENSISMFTHQIIRDAVLAIRAQKLPDPSVQPNSGSFFKNAIIDDWHFTELQQKYPDIISYEMGDGRKKIPTGWLIQSVGLKGQIINGMRIHEKNAVVLINESATGYADLATAREEIIGKVRDTFRIQIEQEPLEITT